MGSWTTEALVIGVSFVVSAHIVASAITSCLRPPVLEKPSSKPEANPVPQRADAVDHTEPARGLWTDDELAAREREERPDTYGADHTLVDTFGLEEDERQAVHEALLRDGRRPRSAAPP